MNAVRWLWVGCLAALVFAPGAAAGAEEPPGYKSPDHALLWSFLGTAVPVGGAFIGDQQGWGSATAILGLGGAVVGPSLGHFYAQRPGRAWLGIGVRTLALGGLALSAQNLLSEETSGGDAMLVLSFVAGTGMAVYDIATAPKSAKAHNAQLQAVRITVSPVLLGQEKAPGVRVDVAF